MRYEYCIVLVHTVTEGSLEWQYRKWLGLPASHVGTPHWTPSTVPEVAASAAAMPTIWYHGERSYSTDGRNPCNVSPEKHNLLRAFLDNDVAIGTRELEAKGVSNVPAVISKLCKTFGDGLVQRPARKGDGYYIRVRSLKDSG
jgi:hypothetical protein